MRHRIVAIVLCGACARVAAVVPVSKADDLSAPAETLTAALPSDAELEAAGARIGGIEIRTIQIFDLSDPKDDNWLFRTADHLHKGTRVSAIAAQLLFRRGDLYSRRLLEETARNIRLNSSFLREPVIRPIRYHDNVVDILVITHDVWTLQPGISFGRSGGATTPASTSPTPTSSVTASRSRSATARTSIAAPLFCNGSIRTSGAAIGPMARCIRAIPTARCGAWAPASRSTRSKPEPLAGPTSVTITAFSPATAWARPMTPTTIIGAPPTCTSARPCVLPTCGPNG